MPDNDTTNIRVCALCSADISFLVHNAKSCADCRAEYKRRYMRERMSDDNLRAAHNDRRRERIASDCEYRAKVNARQRQWRDKRMMDPIYRAKRNARKRELEVERRKRDIAYYEAHKRYQREWKRNRYATDTEYRDRVKLLERLRKPWDATVNADSVAARLEAQKGKCACCDTDIRAGYELDHILPQSKGGASTLENLQLMSPSCNSRKHAKLAYFPPDGGQGFLALGI